MSNRVVYRCFDEFGLLLYIGCSKNFKQRWRAHRRGAPWAPYFASATLSEPLPTHRAFKAELRAIDTEDSFFNVTTADFYLLHASIHAADREMRARGHRIVRANRDDAWRAERDAIRYEIKDRYPFVSNEDRLARYLEARAVAANEVAA